MLRRINDTLKDEFANILPHKQQPAVVQAFVY